MFILSLDRYCNFPKVLSLLCLLQSQVMLDSIKEIYKFFSSLSILCKIGIIFIHSVFVGFVDKITWVYYFYG